MDLLDSWGREDPLFAHERLMFDFPLKATWKTEKNNF